MLKILLILFMPLFVYAGELTEITIFDLSGETPQLLKKKITEQDTLSRFAGLWRQKKSVELEAKYKWRYKLNIIYKQRKRGSSTWFYDPSGYTRLLTKRKTPDYQLLSPDELNRLLGIF